MLQTETNIYVDDRITLRAKVIFHFPPIPMTFAPLLIIHSIEILDSMASIQPKCLSRQMSKVYSGKSRRPSIPPVPGLLPLPPFRLFLFANPL